MCLTYSFENELISVCCQPTSHDTKVGLGILFSKNKVLITWDLVLKLQLNLSTSNLLLLWGYGSALQAGIY